MMVLRLSSQGIPQAQRGDALAHSTARADRLFSIRSAMASRPLLKCV
jgi:hypothetical protein